MRGTRSGTEAQRLDYHKVESAQIKWAERSGTTILGMLIAEELLLMCLDPESGRTAVRRSRLSPALGGALLVDLVLMERISLTPDETGRRQRRRVQLISRSRRMIPNSTSSSLTRRPGLISRFRTSSATLPENASSSVLVIGWRRRGC
ncbi:MAG TPA: GPP34 family phosphoprotein [Propionibacteriaceae bacterium]